MYSQHHSHFINGCNSVIYILASYSSFALSPQFPVEVSVKPLLQCGMKSFLKFAIALRWLLLITYLLKTLTHFVTALGPTRGIGFF